MDMKEKQTMMESIPQQVFLVTLKVYSLYFSPSFGKDFLIME
nr:hypothetical protein [Bacillus pseudomycoides]